MSSPLHPHPAVGFRMSGVPAAMEGKPVPTGEQGDDRFLFSMKDFCDEIKSKEDIKLSILSTYSLHLDHALRQCASLFDSPVVLFHGSQLLQPDECPEWVSLLEDPATRAMVQLCYVNPKKIKYHRDRALHGPSAASFDSVRAQGVHHSKYLIVVTEQRMHVAITTANLVGDRSLNIAWTKSFDRIPAGTDGAGGGSRGGSASARGGEEFGAILEDFVYNVSHKYLLNVFLALHLCLHL
jgi:hypothetical protein